MQEKQQYNNGGGGGELSFFLEDFGRLKEFGKLKYGAESW